MLAGGTFVFGMYNLDRVLGSCVTSSPLAKMSLLVAALTWEAKDISRLPSEAECEKVADFFLTRPQTISLAANRPL
jgi:hypothetical protein